MASKTKPTLYALLIAIGDYQSPVSKLAGTIADLRDMETYLKEVEADHFTVDIRTLKEDQATKDNIIVACLEHFCKAGPEDSVLLFFAGHGTREYAHSSVWTTETNNLLECLVCYDGVKIDEEGELTTNLLADKELRYLLHEASSKGAHVSAVFDCCNSGENTRSALPQVVRRFTPPSNGATAFPRRSLNQFFFWADLKAKALINDEVQPLSTWLPEGRHVQLAACRGREFAYENTETNRGAFTESLVTTLRKSGGKVTYRDLQAEVSNNLRGRFDQQPEAYPSTNPEDLFSTFLGKAVEPRPNYGIVQYNQPEDGEARWVINMGGISGLTQIGTKVLVDTPDGQLAAEVSRVNLAFSELSFAPAAAPDPTNTYRGVPSTQHLPALPILVSFAAHAPAPIIAALTKLLSEKSTLKITGNAAAAKYELSADEEKSWLTLPGDHRPLIHPVQLDDTNFTLTWNRYFDHLVEWHRLLDLENPAPFRFKKFPLQITLGVLDENEQETELPDREYHQLTFLPDAEEGQHRTISFRIRNTHDTELFVALLAFGRDFLCTSKFLTPSVVALPTGSSTAIFNDRRNPGQLQVEPNDYMVKDRWPVDSIWIKCIASTNETALKSAVQEFELQALPHPHSREKNFRSITPYKPRRTGPDWITRTFRFDFKLEGSSTV
ncbi:caspase family protein [Neolewinella persica]|uniref:caspase family protein n=1 Tax=Neolewinella persica TaxID=70998 RepID=UPI00036BA25C|nr:caspase family protein [Neolewinella persica]